MRCLSFVWRPLGEDDFLEYTDGVIFAPYSLYRAVAQNPDRLLDFQLYHRFIEKGAFDFIGVASRIGRERFGEEPWIDAIRARINGRFDTDDIVYNGKRGLAIVSPILCERLVPRLYERFKSNCDWSQYR